MWSRSLELLKERIIYKKEKTYIVLTNKAIELGRDQRRKIVEAYEKITTTIRKEDMKVTMLTLSKIRNLLKDVQ